MTPLKSLLNAPGKYEVGVKALTLKRLPMKPVFKVPMRPRVMLPDGTFWEWRITPKGVFWTLFGSFYIEKS